MLYNVHTLDVWGNAEDGYDVNDVYPSVGVVELSNDMTDNAIFMALKDADIAEGDIDKAGIMGEHGYTLYISYDNMPIFELRPVDTNNAMRQGG